MSPLHDRHITTRIGVWHPARCQQDSTANYSHVPLVFWHRKRFVAQNPHRLQTSPPMPPPGELDETYASSFIRVSIPNIYIRKHDVIHKTGSDHASAGQAGVSGVWGRNGRWRLTGNGQQLVMHPLGRARPGFRHNGDYLLTSSCFFCAARVCPAFFALYSAISSTTRLNCTKDKGTFTLLQRP